MKRYTSRDLNQKRSEIIREVRAGGCVIEYKNVNRETDFEAVLIPRDEYERLKKSSVDPYTVKQIY